MKKTFLLFAALYFSLSFLKGWGVAAFAQNLVPNPSFEDTIHCPIYNNIGVIQAKHWFGVYDSANEFYFNGCSTPLQWGVPQTGVYGFQYPQDGNAFAGLINGTVTNGNKNHRVYLETKLIDTLLKGKNYTVSFYASLMDSSYNRCSEMSVYFSPFEIIKHSDSVIQGVTSQINNNPITNPLNSTTLWILISDTFTAKGNEAWMIIGNFKDYLQTKVDTNIYGAWYLPNSFYYVDNVSVIENKKDGIQEIPKIKVNIFPNPTNDFINVRFSDNVQLPNKASIYNENGIEVWSKTNFTEKNLKIDFTTLPSGIYIFHLQNQTELITKKITKI